MCNAKRRKARRRGNLRKEAQRTSVAIDGAVFLIKRSRDRTGSTNQQTVAPSPGREREEREAGPRRGERRIRRRDSRGGAKGWEREGSEGEEEGEWEGKGREEKREETKVGFFLGSKVRVGREVEDPRRALLL